MKKIILLIIIIVITLIFIYPPKKIDKGGGQLPTKFYSVCKGVYIETYNQTPVDGTRGGWCLGKISQVENLYYQDFMNQQQQLIQANNILPPPPTEKKEEIHKLLSFTGSKGIFVASSQGITEVKVYYYHKDAQTIEKLFGSMELVDTDKNSKVQTWTLPPGASQTLADWAIKIYAIGYSGEGKNKKENQVDYKYSGSILSGQSLIYQ